MDCSKTGEIIKKLRKEKQLTQLNVAEKLFISDKAVSKWERGQGFPDISLIEKLSELLGVSPEVLINGQICINDPTGGNMKKLKFYVCNECGNLIVSTNEADISCCGKKLNNIHITKAEENQKLNVSIIENEYFISSEHEMTRENYITFVALLTSDTMMVRKQYPEWNLQTRIPCFAHGMLCWYSKNEGLLYQMI